MECRAALSSGTGQTLGPTKGKQTKQGTIAPCGERKIPMLQVSTYIKLIRLVAKKTKTLPGLAGALAGRDPQLPLRNSYIGRQ